MLATGLGLLFGAINVTFRDAQNFVEIIMMCAVWASPVMYQWEMVAEKVPGWLFTLYRLNPLTAAVELFHYGLWMPLNPTDGQTIPNLWAFAGIGLAVSLVILFIGQAVFRRLGGALCPGPLTVTRCRASSRTTSTRTSSCVTPTPSRRPRSPLSAASR